MKQDIYFQEIVKNREKLLELKDDDDRVLDNLYSYDCILECWEQRYGLVVDFCLKNNVKSITDIGTAFSSQGAAFNIANIEYNVINDLPESYKDRYVSFASYQVGFYGKDEFVTDKNSLAVAILSIGWGCYVDNKMKEKQISQLSKDFLSCLLNLPNDEYLNKYFSKVEKISANMWFCSNK